MRRRPPVSTRTDTLLPNTTLFRSPPPPLETGSPWDLSTDPRYAGIDIPLAESLKDTVERVLPYYEAAIVPELAAGKPVLISAHGNSLRALVKHLSGISDADITGLEIPTGQPIVYDLADDLPAREPHYPSPRCTRERTSVVLGKSGEVRLDSGGRRIC